MAGVFPCIFFTSRLSVALEHLVGVRESRSALARDLRDLAKLLTAHMATRGSDDAAVAAAGAGAAPDVSRFHACPEEVAHAAQLWTALMAARTTRDHCWTRLEQALLPIAAAAAAPALVESDAVAPAAPPVLSNREPEKQTFSGMEFIGF